jgi:hypothetical protein
VLIVLAATDEIKSPMLTGSHTIKTPRRREAIYYGLYEAKAAD